MKKRFYQLAILVILLTAICSIPALAADTRMVRVGLFYGNTAIPTANLENSVGSGYRFGYHDGSGNFVSLASTEKTQITMMKTQNIYLKGGQYSASNPGSPDGVVGCYHVQLPGSYSDYTAAQGATRGYNGSFVTWSSGTYYVRVGAYATQAEAHTALANLGVSGGSIVGTSTHGISVTQTGTTTVLFQFDSNGSDAFVVRPGESGGTKTLTWFKGYKYYGDFRYERVGEGNLTVSSYVNMDDYAKGVVPYEMSASWPTEALKAQAVAAKSYALSIAASKHSSHHFDICNTTCCQVYRGANNATDNSNSAVDAVSGIYAWYDGKYAQTFYYSSNGGASEDSQNVWSATLPYLTGVVDPYEESIASSIPGYRWTVTYSGTQLATRLQARGYACGSSIEEFRITQYSRVANVIGIELIDNNGKSFAFKKEGVRTILGVNSIRFQLEGSGSGGNSFYIDDGTAVQSVNGMWAIGENGEKGQISSDTPTVITASGTQQLSGGGGGSSAVKGTFVLNGAGNGHNIGMSQYGANAMAKQGFSYQDILKFYYMGIDLH